MAPYGLDQSAQNDRSRLPGGPMQLPSFSDPYRFTPEDGREAPATVMFDLYYSFSYGGDASN